MLTDTQLTSELHFCNTNRLYPSTGTRQKLKIWLSFGSKNLNIVTRMIFTGIKINLKRSQVSTIHRKWSLLWVQRLKTSGSPKSKLILLAFPSAVFTHLLNYEKICILYIVVIIKTWSKTAFKCLTNLLKSNLAQQLFDLKPSNIVICIR